MEFRARDYRAEEERAASALPPRVPALDHPLAALRTTTATTTTSTQVDDTDGDKVDFYDPLRRYASDAAVPIVNVQHGYDTNTRRLSGEAVQLSLREWAVFRRSLMQKFSYSSTVPISSTSDIIARSGKEHEKSLTSMHLEELDDPQKAVKEEIKVVTRQEYVSRLHELKDEIKQAWSADDRVTSLKLSIKVARLLMDTSVLQFYPTIFILVTDLMDMLGDLVWERIKRKAEYSDDGTLVCSLTEDFISGDVCSDAKETCNNWFCKIGSIRELIPRIYLELAILRCWRFLQEDHYYNLQRLTMMMRGLADPLASAYCHLYMARCAQTLLPRDKGYLIMSISHITILLRRIISDECNNKKILISLLEPAIEWIMKCLFMDEYQEKVGVILEKFGFGRSLSKSTSNVPSFSIVLHYLVKELPVEIISVNAFEILEQFEHAKDISLDQYLNYRLLGLKLSECQSPSGSIDSVLNKVFQVVTQYDGLNEYLMIVDAYLDIILYYRLDTYLSLILDGISNRSQNKRATENDMDILHSIIVKLVNHFDGLEDLFALNHFMEILDLLYGSSRDLVNMHVLTKVVRNGHIQDPKIIQLLFEISQALHDSINFSCSKDDHQQRARLISRFVQMADFGVELECQLTFLVECRAAFGSGNEIKESLVHLSNSLAIKAIKATNKFLGFFKACIAFSEVTIPSISASTSRMNLYLETAEVALVCGLVSHADGLICSAISCLQSFDLSIVPHIPTDVDRIFSSICKLCSILVMIPGNPEEGIAYVPRSILSTFGSLSWITPAVQIKTLCALVSVSATLSQNELPYHANNKEVVGNDQLFFGETSYNQELMSVSSLMLQKLVNNIDQEPCSAALGKVALEACNCLIVSFKASHEVSLVCFKLIDVAKSCLHPKDKYLQSTMNFLDKHLSEFLGNASTVSL